ncbi:hypothetical protein MMC14_002671 [Varicellaria rhodocarpa]|nr:hypothetical protein [Varicellaria rhodocarpa]
MFVAIFFTCVALVISVISVFRYYKSRTQIIEQIPVSVNYHLTRRCNYNCGFCFHTATTSYVLPLVDAKKGLALLKEAGMKKINFAGGEPFLNPNFLGKLAKYCKEDLHLESVSVVTNGSKVTESWLSQFGKYMDIMAVSCDSFDEQTNIKIGRGTGSHLDSFKKLSKWCKEANIKFKVNTVVNRFNFDENMNKPIRDINPFRWKCFQVLIVPGENESNDRLRNATNFVITDEEFDRFCRAHSNNACFVPEPNNVMRSSYLILDEYMRFLNKGTGDPTKSILDVGVEAAMQDVLWDEESFVARDGIYDWSKKTCSSDAQSGALDF